MNNRVRLFSDPVWVLVNKETERILPPFKSSYGCWYRGVYNSKSAASIAVSKLNKEFSEIRLSIESNRYTQEQCVKYFGEEVVALVGEYQTLKICGVLVLSDET